MTTPLLGDNTLPNDSEHTFNRYSQEALTLRCTAHDLDIDFDIFSCTEDGESSSCSSSSEGHDSDDEDVTSQCTEPPTVIKVVRFDETIRVRKHTVTVGFVPASRDSCPITLDWPFVEYHTTSTELAGVDESQSSCAQRLSLNQRRQQIARVQGWQAEQVRVLEKERLLERMEEIMNGHNSCDKIVLEKEEDRSLQKSSTLRHNSVPEKDFLAFDHQWKLQKRTSIPSLPQRLGRVAD